MGVASRSLVVSIPERDDAWHTLPSCWYRRGKEMDREVPSGHAIDAKWSCYWRGLSWVDGMNLLRDVDLINVQS